MTAKKIVEHTGFQLILDCHEAHTLRDVLECYANKLEVLFPEPIGFIADSLVVCRNVVASLDGAK